MKALSNISCEFHYLPIANGCDASEWIMGAEYHSQLIDRSI